MDSYKNLHIDHIAPKAKGATTTRIISCCAVTATAWKATAPWIAWWIRSCNGNVCWRTRLPSGGVRG